jgi:hypothetical protein
MKLMKAIWLPFGQLPNHPKAVYRPVGRSGLDDETAEGQEFTLRAIRF